MQVGDGLAEETGCQIMVWPETGSQKRLNLVTHTQRKEACLVSKHEGVLLINTRCCLTSR